MTRKTKPMHSKCIIGKTLTFILATYFMTICAAPVKKSTLSKKPLKPKSDMDQGVALIQFILSKKIPTQNLLALIFLVKYGYLLQDEERTQQDLVDATVEFQQMYGLRVTGQLDKDTLALMTSPRCGLSDATAVTQFLGKASGNSKHLKGRWRKPNSVRKSIIKPYRVLSHLNRNPRKKRFSYMGQWPSTNITYGFRSYTSELTTIDQQNAIAHALKVWSRGTPLSFMQKYQADVDIKISFERGFHNDGYPFDGPGHTLAHAFFPGQGERSGDVHLDADEKWTYKSSEGTSLFMVAVHEVGHALGLGHSNSPGSVMLPFYQGQKDNVILGSDDRMAVQHLYGGNIKMGDIVSGNKPSIFAGPTLTAYDGIYDPDVCSMSFDAAANIRSEMYFFKGFHFWRFLLTGTNISKAEVGTFFMGFPKVNVDAVYSYEEKIRIFSGNQYWSYNNNIKDKDSPRPISDFGLPMDGGIDAAFVWTGINDGTYFFKGSKYWNYDEKNEEMQLSYPRSIRQGIPTKVDAAFTNPDDNKVYFLTGRLAWQMNNDLLATKNPEYIGYKWFDCPKEEPIFEGKGPNATKGLNHTTRESGKKDNGDNGASARVSLVSRVNVLFYCLVSFFLLFVCKF